ncbi:MAG TPA: hypothetical protein VJS91_08165 [Nitrososphaeraceae archaeon]|nr:hypothetical protein [Nitrososphaeraceae archaeon]
MNPNTSNQISRLTDDDSKFESCVHEPVTESYENSLTADRAISLAKNKVKPIPSRIDYNFFNYCSICEVKYPKQILRCKDCNQKVRTRPWHRSKIIDQKRI